MTGPRPTDCSDRGPEGHMIQRMTTCIDGGPPRGERGGPEGHVTQRMTTCIDGGPPRGERGGHFEAPA